MSGRAQIDDRQPPMPEPDAPIVRPERPRIIGTAVAKRRHHRVERRLRRSSTRLRKSYDSTH
jgi:hypothetical protein